MQTVRWSVHTSYSLPSGILVCLSTLPSQWKGLYRGQLFGYLLHRTSLDPPSKKWPRPCPEKLLCQSWFWRKTGRGVTFAACPFLLCDLLWNLICTHDFSVVLHSYISKLWPELFSESHACVSSYLLDISTWAPNRPPKDTAKTEAHLFFYSSLSPTSPVSPFCPMSPGSFQHQRSWSFRLATPLPTHLVGFWTLVPSNSSVRVSSLCFLAFQQHTFITSITAASSLGIFPVLFFSFCSSSSVRVNFLEGNLTVSVSSSNLFWWMSIG